MAPSSGDYELAAPEIIEALALRALYSSGGSIETQRKLHAELVEQLRGEEKRLRVSEERMRSVLLTSKRIAVDVRYASRPVSAPLRSCPVCHRPIREIYNETLDGGRVIAGYKCSRCPFWTPIRRRVPARYTFRVTR